MLSHAVNRPACLLEPVQCVVPQPLVAHPPDRKPAAPPTDGFDHGRDEREPGEWDQQPAQARNAELFSTCNHAFLPFKPRASRRGTRPTTTSGDCIVTASLRFTTRGNARAVSTYDVDESLSNSAEGDTCPGKRRTDPACYTREVRHLSKFLPAR